MQPRSSFFVIIDYNYIRRSLILQSFIRVILILLIVLNSIVLFYYLRQNKQSNKTNKQRFMQRYPEIDEKAYKLRQQNIGNYQRVYLSSRYTWYMRLAVLALVVFLASGILAVLDYFSLSIQMIGTCFILFGISLIMLPSFKTQIDFWQNYLTEHPENDLKIIISPLNSPLQQRRLALLLRLKILLMIEGLLIITFSFLY